MEKISVVLLDDDVAVLEVISEELSFEFDVKRYSDPSEFIAFVRNQNPFDILIIDYKMGMTKGTEVLKILSSENLRSFGTILLSGFVDKPLLKQCIELGVDGVFEKPCSFMELKLELYRAYDRVKNRKLALEALSLISDLKFFLEKKSDLDPKILERVNKIFSERNLKAA